MNSLSRIHSSTVKPSVKHSVKLVAVLLLVSLLALAACERRQVVYAGIDAKKGNPGSTDTVDPHKNYE